MKYLLMLVCAGLAAAAPSNDDYLRFEPAPRMGNLVEEADMLGLKILVDLVKSAGLGELLMDKTLTVFGPTDEAFERVPEHIKEYLQKNKTALKEVLLYHSVSGVVNSKDIMNDELTASNVDMAKIRLNIYMEGMMKMVDAEGAKVTKADNMASNGVIHVIDEVMFPIPRLNIAEYLMRDKMYFSTLLTALQAADFSAVFEGPGPFTLFAPDDAAFKKLPAGVLDKILKDKMKLTELLKYHVVSKTYFANGLPAHLETMEEGKSLMIKKMGDRVMINDAQVDYPNRKVTNGVIHVIDKVLMPPMEEAVAPAAGNVIEVCKQLNLKTLLTLADAAGLTDMAEYNTLTLLAPSDEAFAKLPASMLAYLKKNMTALTELLMYHAIPDAIVMSKDLTNEEVVASGDDMMDNIRFNIYPSANGMKMVTADGAMVVKADQTASNGVVHVLDSVMHPIPTGTAADFLMGDQSYFSMLLDAAKEAGLQDVLEGPGPFTLFAPDDAAVKKLPPATLDKLMKDKTMLQEVLAYHVLPQTLYSVGMKSGEMYMTGDHGQKVKIVKMADGVKVNDAKVIYADISVSNGVVHIVDSVLMPPM